uniref:Bifunctional inhibitor/plant lipid transfer protein/seed storage helical domain-containing protein n=1 Tax=Lactuca sativa TaxID=4236 RepID=A0A9R1WQ83_LACSA|nr:hypothetical protein LSAT_V11C100034050 [Lactuca sativa]
MAVIWNSDGGGKRPLQWFSDALFLLPSTVFNEGSMEKLRGGQGQDPPDSCCDPLKSVIKSNPECLCSIISNQGTKNVEHAGINVTKAQELPARCGTRDSQSLGNSMVYLLYSLMLIAIVYG